MIKVITKKEQQEKHMKKLKDKKTKTKNLVNIVMLGQFRTLVMLSYQDYISEVKDGFCP